MNNLKPPHQSAAAWAEELDEHLPRMTYTVRRLFLEAVAEMAMQHLDVITIATIAQDGGIATELVGELTRALDE